MSDSILDQISAEVAALSDEQLAEAATKLLARAEKSKAAMTPERKQKMKDAETKRRKVNAAIVKLAKAKGLVPATA